MINVYQINDIPRSRQLARWQQFMSEVYYRLEIKSDRADGLRGELKEYPLADMSVSRFFSDRQRVLRTRGRIAEDPEDSFVFVFPVRNSLYYEQLGRNGYVQPGEYVMVRTTEFYELSCPDSFRNVTLKIPGSHFRESGVRPEDHLSCRYPNNRAVARLLRAFLSSVCTMEDEERQRLTRSIRSQILSLATVLLESEMTGLDGDGTTNAESLYKRILRHIDDHLESEHLTPELTAQSFSISRTYLDKMFAKHGTTFGRTVLHKRLDRCYGELADPKNLHQPISQVAFRFGFSNHSHFSRVFRAHFGLAPREVHASQGTLPRTLVVRDLTPGE